MTPTPEALAPFIACLAGVPQNPAYHGEGDALTHTHMVMDALTGMAAYQALSACDQELLLAAAALHDIGKKATTRRADGQWTSPNHSLVGSIMARQWLITQCGLCGTQQALRLRETLCALIRHHMRPLHIFGAVNPERAVRGVASAQELLPGFTLHMLSLLAEADCRGRVSNDLTERLQEVALFRELALEQGCLHRAYAYPNAFSRYADLSGRRVAPGQKLYNDTWGTVVMLSGLPGTGKDTYARAQYPDMPMLSLDDVRRQSGVKPTDNQGGVAQAAREIARSYLRKKEPFVFNATNLSTMLRRGWISLFHQYGAAVHIIYMETPWEERRKRNLSRTAAVPEDAVLRMLSHMEPPSLMEAEEVSWVCV